MRNIYEFIAGKREQKKPLAKRRCVCENNITVNIKEIQYGTNRMQLLKPGPLAGPCEKGNEISDPIKRNLLFSSANIGM